MPRLEVARLMSASAQNILAINCGSSSLKFGLFSVTSSGTSLICEGEGEEIGRASGQFWFRHAQDEKKQKRALANANHDEALQEVFKALEGCGAPKPDAVGHRFVHGGPKLREHHRVDSVTLKILEDAVEFAPLHMPAALAVLKDVGEKLPALPQVVCLDTAFHRTMPDVSRRFALSAEAVRLGVERFGFHGLSLESVIAQMSDVPEKLVIAHLGNGCSISAVYRGQSIDTTMGLTPTGGIMMGSRCGDLDPGVFLFLMQRGVPDHERLSTLVDHQSGLLGVSETTSDVRTLMEARKTDSRADLALRMFTYQAKKAAAAMAAALGGLDALVFAGGIGENNEQVRAEIASGLSFLGPFSVKVFPSQEDLQIAKITAGLLTA